MILPHLKNRDIKKTAFLNEIHPKKVYGRKNWEYIVVGIFLLVLLALAIIYG